MILSEYLGSLKTREAVLSATSFDDLGWRNKSKVMAVKSVKAAVGVPAEVMKGTGISTDALHFLNVYRTFKQPATIKEFLIVLQEIKKGEWDNKYSQFHLGMYGSSFVQLGLMVPIREDASEYRKESKVVFLPVFTVEDEKYSFVNAAADMFEVTEPGIRGDRYLSMSIYDGRRAVRGETSDSDSVGMAL